VGVKPVAAKYTNLVHERDSADLFDFAPSGEHWHARHRQPRTLLTRLTDDQLRDYGLEVVPRGSTNASFGTVVDIRLAGSMMLDWLVEPKTTELASDWLDSLAERIEDLRTIAEAEGAPFSAESAEQALKFVTEFKPSIRPSAFLVGNGNVRLVWVAASGEQVGLQFRGADEIQYVLFKSRQGKLVHVMGTDTHAGCVETVRALGLSRLMLKS